jgi:hypothetical protein
MVDVIANLIEQLLVVQHRNMVVQGQARGFGLEASGVSWLTSAGESPKAEA